MNATNDTDDSGTDAEPTDALSGSGVYLVSGFDEFDTWMIVDGAGEPITERIHTDKETAETVKMALKAYLATHPGADRDDLCDFSDVVLGKMAVSATPTEEFDFEAHFDSEDTDDSSTLPKALVSRIGDVYHVIGADSGETQYATGIEDEDAAYAMARAINEEREYDLNAERLANDDDVIFAITREERDAWVPGALKGLAAVAAIGLTVDAYRRLTSDDTEQ